MRDIDLIYLKKKGELMNMQEVAKKLAFEHKMPKADRYDLHYREFDDMVEVIGYVQDPNYNIDNFVGREMLFSKRWVTLGVLPAETQLII